MPLIRTVISFFRWFWPAPPTDHRGRRVKVAIMRFGWPASIARKLGMPVDELRRIYQTLKQSHVCVAQTIILSVAIMLIAVLIISITHSVFRFLPATTSNVRLMSSGLFNIAFVSAMGALPGLCIGRIHMRHKEPLAIQEMLAAGYCPACAYKLANLPTAPDNCTVCPECQAAWRLPQVLGPSPAHPSPTHPLPQNNRKIAIGEPCARAQDEIPS